VLDGSLTINAGIYDLYKSLNESDPDRYLLEQILSDSISCFKTPLMSLTVHCLDTMITKE